MGRITNWDELTRRRWVYRCCLEFNETPPQCPACTDSHTCTPRRRRRRRQALGSFLWASCKKGRTNSFSSLSLMCAIPSLRCYQHTYLGTGQQPPPRPFCTAQGWLSLEIHPQPAVRPSTRERGATGEPPVDHPPGLWFIKPEAVNPP